MKRIILILGLSLFVTTTGQTYKLLFRSIAMVESRNGEFLNDSTHDAIGIIQIRPVMIDEVNRIIGYKKYTIDDRWDNQKSFEIFKIYQDCYNPNYHIEKGIRMWNGGPTGHKKSATLVYLKKVLKEFEKINI